MTIPFKPLKIRKSFYSKKVVYIAGINMSTREYMTGVVSKNKQKFIEVLKDSLTKEAGLIVSVKKVKDKSPQQRDLIWFNPGTQGDN